ncbi:SDR family NAD(P)-dependent oxidoreductase [Radicibacter daui]|uniref:SDR family NAD(P)-dependent oxidoreductase n=1 Tax=Radicibacter daui TaxID=3064829 RepID=UPI004047012B
MAGRSADIVLITGAAGNLGAAVAAELASQGFRLALAERTPKKLEALVASLPDRTECLKLPGLDLGDLAVCRQAVEAVRSHFGGLGGLVNTVGGFDMAAVGEEGLDQWDRLLGLNARTTYTISAAVLPVMQQAGYGRILHVAAAPGLKAGAKQAAYAASKAAVIRLTEAMAAENRAHGITANCILPGTLDTPQNRAAMPEADRSGWLAPASLARLMAFLVSPGASAVTGAAIPATGF